MPVRSGGPTALKTAIVQLTYVKDGQFGVLSNLNKLSDYSSCLLSLI